jgi:hypothetical protein
MPGVVSTMIILKSTMMMKDHYYQVSNSLMYTLYSIKIPNYSLIIIRSSLLLIIIKYHEARGSISSISNHRDQIIFSKSRQLESQIGLRC